MLALLSTTELSELYDQVADRIMDMLMPALTLANRTGELAQLLKLLGMNDLIGEDDMVDLRATRVLVLGDSMVKEGKLKSLANKYGFDSSLFDFELGYTSLKHFNFSKLRYSDKYRAVLVGPMPHSTPGKKDSSSVIAEMEKHPDVYPSVIRLRDSNGQKITNNSFTKGLNELALLSA